MNNTTHLFDSAQIALLLTVFIGALGALTFFTAEPSIGRTATTTAEFTVTQTVSGAISFNITPSDITMVGTLDGLSGGTAYGSTTVNVKTNNSAGYQMTIMFASTAPMVKDSGTGYISSYRYSTGTASYPTGFDTSPLNSQIGFTVNASNTSDVSPVFTHNGSLCGTSNNGSFTVNNCWRGASTTATTSPTQLILTSAPTPASGSTSTIQFRVTIPNNPNPVVPDGTYTATATLTATDN